MDWGQEGESQIQGNSKKQPSLLCNRLGWSFALSGRTQNQETEYLRMAQPDLSPAKNLYQDL